MGWERVDRAAISGLAESFGWGRRKQHNKGLTYVPLACGLPCQVVALPAGLGKEWTVAGKLATHLKCGVNSKTEGLASFSSLS